MKKLTLFLALLVSTFKANSQLAVEYRFENTSGTGILTPYYVNSGILATATNVYAGAGITPSFSGGVNVSQGCSCQPNDKGYVGSSWGNPNAFGSTFNPTDHLGFTLTPLGANTIVIDSVTWWQRRTAVGPKQTELRTSNNGYSTSIGWHLSSDSDVNLYIPRKVVGLPNSSVPIDIRLYGYDATDNSGILRVDTLRVYAHLLQPLPVELLYFSGTQSGKSINLSWATATERNNDYFTLFSESSGGTWEDVGRVEGVGDSQSQTDYQFVDNNPKGEVVYYRLRQTDNDGTIEDLGIIAVPFRTTEDLVYRVGGIASIKGEQSIMYDQIGRIVSSLRMEHVLNLEGIFFLQGEHGTTKRLVVTQ